MVTAFCRLLDDTAKVSTNHWAREPGPGWFHDPFWTRIFPQYDTSDRAEGIGRSWDEYSARAAELARRFPDNVRVWDADVLTSEAGVREVLEFVGVPRERQVIITGERTGLPEPMPRQSEEARQSPAAKAPPAACGVIVPHTGFIHPECDDALEDLEWRGYRARRVGGFEGHGAGGCCAATHTHQKPRSHDTSRIAWAKLMARVGEEFPLACPNCGGDIRLISFMTEPGPIRKILTHLGEPLGPPPLALARGPPTEWGELVQVHDDREIFQASSDELPAIDIHSL